MDANTAAKHDTRNQAGQYDPKSETVCTCGHTRGIHSERGAACFAGDPCYGGEICDCEKFRRSTKKAAK